MGLDRLEGTIKKVFDTLLSGETGCVYEVEDRRLAQLGLW